jgi:hypothetical protein
MVEHVKNRGWSDIEHYHRHQSECSDEYGVGKIPYAFMLDKTGRIVFKGDPSVRQNILADFDTLIKGERLTG